jgi:zinc transporter 1
MGCIGLFLNIISAVCLHEDDEKPAQDTLSKESDRDLSLLEKGDPHAGHLHIERESVSLGRDVGMMGVLIHVLGDALNNIGVIIAALVIWLAKYEGKYYADPAVGIAIALLILASAYPLSK